MVRFSTLCSTDPQHLDRKNDCRFASGIKGKPDSCQSLSDFLCTIGSRLYSNQKNYEAVAHGERVFLRSNYYVFWTGMEKKRKVSTKIVVSSKSCMWGSCTEKDKKGFLYDVIKCFSGAHRNKILSTASVCCRVPHVCWGCFHAAPWLNVKLDMVNVQCFCQMYVHWLGTRGGQTTHG